MGRESVACEAVSWAANNACRDTGHSVTGGRNARMSFTLDAKQHKTDRDKEEILETAHG
jgi:hypothetical protein